MDRISRSSREAEARFREEGALRNDSYKAPFARHQGVIGVNWIGVDGFCVYAHDSFYRAGILLLTVYLAVAVVIRGLLWFLSAETGVAVCRVIRR